MSFNLRIKFSGICTFVPNRSLDQGPTKMTVVLPNAESDTLFIGESADGKPRRRHRGFVRFNLKNLTGGHMLPENDELVGVWYLGRRFLKFDCKSNVSTGLHIADLDALIKLEKVAPDFSSVDAAAVKAWPPPKNVLSRMVLESGLLRVGNRAENFVLPNTLNPQASLEDLRLESVAADVVHEIQGIDSLALTAIPFETGPSAAHIKLEAPKNDWVEITVANLCDDNPLQWPTRFVQASGPDIDFKWHYELLKAENRDNLVKLVDGLDLPVPIPTTRSNGLGADCFSSIAPPVDH